MANVVDAISCSCKARQVRASSKCSWSGCNTASAGTMTEYVWTLSHKLTKRGHIAWGRGWFIAGWKEMYGTASKKLIKKVQTKQNRAIKVLHNKNFYTPTTQLHKELRYPLVKDIEKINVCKFVHKQRNNKTPKIFNDLFTENKDIHKYNTRQSQNLATPLAATNFSQKTIDFRGPRTWNSIPMKIRKLECNKHFGKKLRAHLIDKLT